jgi:hypothetical protein
MRYINTGDEYFLVQGVPKRPPQRTKSRTKYIQEETGQSIPKQDIGSDHQLCKPYTKLINKFE